MAKTNSVVVVNGNRYDGLSGALVSGKPHKAAGHIAHAKKMVDGFTLGPHHIKKSTKASPAVRKNAAQGLHQRPQRPVTLRRGGLAKPAKHEQPATKSPHTQPSSHPLKALRAKTVTQHDQVKRFGHFAPKAQLAAGPTNKIHRANAKLAATQAIPAKMPSLVTSVSHRKLDRMLDEALIRADAHKQMLNAQNRKRRMAFGRLPGNVLIGFIAAAVVALIVWQNLPSVAAHVKLFAGL